MIKKSKKIIVCLLLVMFIMLNIVLLSGCENANNEQIEDNYIELTMDNYEYYLTFTRVNTGSGNIASGTYRYATYDLTISGAIYGIYVDCVIFYNNNKSSIKLNAAGNAQTSYSIVNGSSSFVISNVSGRIYI